MTGIDKYISELLFEHDCVILPGFGGFLTNYSGARIHPIRHSFHPPSRTVVFNANLKTNDGLLTDYLSRTQKISYQEASLAVNQYAAKCLDDLKAGENIEFQNIGTCRMGRENNIVFEPDTTANYLTDAFGLPSFVSPAIRRETVRQRLEKQLTPRPTAPVEKKKRNLRPVIGWAAGIAIPIAAAVLIYMYSPNITEGFGNSYASFVPTIKLKPSEPAINASKGTKDAAFSEFRVVPEKVAETTPEPKPLMTPEAKPEVSVATSVKKYQIVVGAFSQESNAAGYVDELQRKKYNASIIGTSKNGLIRVSISGFDSKNDALNMLREVRASENPSAWLLVIR